MERARRRLGVAMASAVLAALPGTATAVTISSSLTTGLNLDLETGSTVNVLGGVTVSNAAFSVPISATTSPWALDNAGTISAANAWAVSLDALGSSVTNSGAITSTSNGVSLLGGGAMTNALGGTITTSATGVRIGTTSAGAGTFENAGIITQTGTLGDLVSLRFGGTVTNLATGQILATSTSNAVSVGQGTSRTVNNYGLIRNTGTSFAAGVLVQGGASTVNNYAGGTIAGTYNGIYASGSASLTLNNAGTISSTGTNANAYAVEASAGGTITNSGTIQSASSVGVYLGGTGTIKNSGTIGGLTTAIRFGSTNVDRTLELGTGSIINGNVAGSGGSGVDGLVLTGSGTESLTRFSAFERLVMNGTAWTVGGTGNFATSATIAGGRLTVDGTLTTPSVSVGTDGTLAGTGTIAGAVTNGGRVAVGTGTLGIAGTFTSNTGSVFEVGATPTLSGLLDISGSATLNGGMVDVQAGGGTYDPTRTYTILTADGGVTGSFAGVSTNLIFLTPSLSYGGTNVYLTLDRSLVSFESVGQTANQRAAGAGLDSIGLASPLAVALAQLDEASAPAALDLVSGEIHAAVPNALALGSRIPRETAMAVIDASFAALGTEPTSIWSTAYGSRGTIASGGDAVALSSASGGVLFGADLLIGDTLLGLFGGVGRIDLDLEDRESAADIGQVHLGVYGRQAIGNWRLKGGAGLSANDIETARNVTVGQFLDTPSANYGSVTAQAFGELAYAFDLGATTLSPYGRLTFIGVSGADYREVGGAAALSGATHGSGQVLTELGLTAESSVTLENGGAIDLRGRVALQQTFADAPEAAHAFDSGDSFTVASASPSGLSAVVEVGIAAALNSATDLDLSISGLVGNASSGAFTATLSGRF